MAMTRQGITRRTFMEQSTAMAAAFATGAFGSAGSALAAREKELNILCWEGYNSAQVLDPFREMKSATVKAESLTNDPTMINRLRAGEINVWDLINVNNPWARKVMYPEGLIKPLDRAKMEPYFAKMLPMFAPPYHWAMSDDGKELLGMCQRFGPYSFVVNTDKISRATAEDQGWDLWNDPANDGKYGILESDDWNVFDICLISGFDPFVEHTDDQVAKFTETAKRVFKGAKLVGDIATMNQAFVAGEIDFHMTGGTYSASPGARRRLQERPRHHAEEGPDGRRQGRRIVDRGHIDRQQSRALAARRRVPAICAGPEDGTRRRLRRGHVQSGGADGEPGVLQPLHARTNSTPSSGTAWKRRWRPRSSTTSCRTTTSCSTS